MARRSVVVVDDFYDNPDKIRRLALSQAYSQKPAATYPGLEAICRERRWDDERQRLRAHIDEACDAPCPKVPPFPQGKFRIALEGDGATRVDKVHVDMQRWSGVVYLTLPEHCREGVVFYRHKPTGSVTWDEGWFKKHFGHLYDLEPHRFREEVQKFVRAANSNPSGSCQWLTTEPSHSWLRCFMAPVRYSAILRKQLD